MIDDVAHEIECMNGETIATRMAKGVFGIELVAEGGPSRLLDREAAAILHAELDDFLNTSDAEWDAEA